MSHSEGEYWLGGVCLHCFLLLQDIVIQQDDEIRLKIVGTRVDKNDIVSLLPTSHPAPGRAGSY